MPGSGDVAGLEIAMGWWQIKDVKSGQVDFDHKAPGCNGLVNAIPGRETEDALYNGDGPADLMGDALRKISKEYEEAWGRPVKKAELDAVFNFCANGWDEMQQEEDNDPEVGRTQAADCPGAVHQD